MDSTTENTNRDLNLTMLRQNIGDLDSEILKLLKQRLDIAKLIGQEKSQCQIPVKDWEMEGIVRERNRATALFLGLSPDLADDLSEFLIRHAIRAQASVNPESSETMGHED
jgi:chorismate mutase